MPAPVVRVQAISFKFEGSKALPLKEGGKPVEAPEWSEESASGSVAYVKSDLEGGFQIEVRFSCAPHTDEVRVRAVRPDYLPRAIGGVAETVVKFPAGTDTVTQKCDVEVYDLSAVHLERVTWQWQVKDGNEWIDATVTGNEIAVTLAKPTEPWTRSETIQGRELPWWEVMRRACFVASGAKTPQEAATKLAETIYGVWGGMFYEWGPSNTYASDAGTVADHWFDCARFLRLIDGEKEPVFVDCSDLASALSTFANILGCNLKQVFVGGIITANRVLPSGHLNWRGRLKFGIHEFTIEEGQASDRLVWDGCLKLTRDAEGKHNRPPEQTPRTELLPTAMPGRRYLGLLRFDDAAVRDDQLSTPSIRPIREAPSDSEPVAEEQPLVAAGLKIAPWLLENVPELPPIGPDFNVDGIPIHRWKLTKSGLAGLVSASAATVAAGRQRDKVLKPIWTSQDDTLMASVDVLFTENCRQARLRALACIGRARVDRVRQVPLLEGVDGEVALVSEDGALAIAIFRNVVVVVRRAGRKPFVISADGEIVTGIRQALKNVPPAQPPG